MKNTKVLETPAASPEAANHFFGNKLAYETDCADVYNDFRNQVTDFVLVDVRSPRAYARSHAINAINLPVADINAESTSDWSKQKLVVTYCWGPGCNGATKAAIRLSALGFQVKEMIGGIEYWEDKEKYPVVRGESLESKP
jgi:rhodanese-related sulfurtransferase